MNMHKPKKKWTKAKIVISAILFLPLIFLSLFLFDVIGQPGIATGHFNLKIAPDQKFVSVNPFCYVCRRFSIQLNLSRDIKEQIDAMIIDSGFYPWEPQFDYGSASEIDDGYPQTLVGYHTRRCDSDQKIPFCSYWMNVNIENGRLDGFHRR